MRNKLLIIHNKMAGRLQAPVLSRVLRELEVRGVSVRLEAAVSVDEDVKLAAAAVKSDSFDAVVAAGGDSTIRGVAMGLVGSDMPLGIIPAGTGNVLAQEIGLGRDAQKIAGLLISGETREITPGLANGDLFLLMAGAGFDAQIVKNLNHALKQRIRKAAYAWPTLKALCAQPKLLRVEFEDETFEAVFVVVARARHYGGSFVIAPDADLTARDLQVVMFTSRGRLGLLQALAGAARGNNARIEGPLMRGDQSVGYIMKTPGVIIRPCQKVRIASADLVQTQIDGEWLGTVPLEISSGKQALNLIMPAA